MSKDNDLAIEPESNQKFQLATQRIVLAELYRSGLICHIYIYVCVRERVILWI